MTERVVTYSNENKLPFYNMKNVNTINHSKEIRPYVMDHNPVD